MREEGRRRRVCEERDREHQRPAPKREIPDRGLDRDTAAAFETRASTPTTQLAADNLTPRTDRTSQTASYLHTLLASPVSQTRLQDLALSH